MLEREQEVQLSQTIDCVKIITLIQQLGRKRVIEIIRSALLNAAKVFKYSENLQIYPATILATDLLEKMKYDSLEDVLIMFRMARRGELGNSKGRLDADVIFGTFLPKYNELKALQWEEKARLEKIENQKTSIRDDEKRTNNSALVEQLHKKFMERNRIDRSLKSIELVDHHKSFIQMLPSVVGGLTEKELAQEMSKAKRNRMWDAYKIYETELNSRK